MAGPLASRSQTINPSVPRRVVNRDSGVDISMPEKDSTQRKDNRADPDDRGCFAF
jgi:hypothetical protein